MTDSANKSRPSHGIYKVTGEGEATRFVKVGAAFRHKDGKGFTLAFDGVPLEGRINLREFREDKAGVSPNPQQITLPIPRPVPAVA